MMIEIARQSALEAGKLALKLRRKGVDVKTKSGETDLVTSADIACERKIIETIQSRFPKHNIISEESGFVDKKSKFTWVIDPIDGTLAYFGNLPTWGISVGLLKDMKPYLGAVFLPDFNELFSAQRGKGSYLNGKRVHVNREAELKKSVVAFDFGYSDRVVEAKEIYLPLIDKVRYPPLFACSV